MTSVSKMEYKDVRDSDPPQPLSDCKLRTGLTFQKTSPVQTVRRNPIKDVQCAQNRIKDVKHVGSVKSVKCPFISQNVSRNTTQKHHFR
jgi:hypothetical protein